ncbi:caspase family protein [Streptomyces sp. NPDC000878]
MTARLPDPRGSRAVLIGTSSYDSPDLKPLLAVRNNLEVLHELLTADSGSFLPARCTVVQDSADPRAVCREIREAAADASDTLLVYFSGHGILNHDYSELHLALSGTDQNDLRWTTVPFQAIREIFETSSCPNKILVLDCCQSGWVLDAMMSDTSRGDAPLDIRGTYLLTSSSGDLKSYAPLSDRYTAFTGELIQLLRDGVPGGPELLPLSALFEPLAAALERRAMPRPQQQGSDGHSALALVRNQAAHRAGEEEAGIEARPAVAGREGRIPETRLRHDAWHRRRIEFSIGAPAVAGLLWVTFRFGPKGEEPVEANSVPAMVMIGVVAGFFLLMGLSSLIFPTNYSLTIGPDGIEVRYSKDQHFYYPWHRVSRVWVVARPRGRLRGTRYGLMLRPKPGVLIKTGRRGSPGPRRDSRTGALCFADVGHLNVPPGVVEKALSRTAGSAWTPSGGSLGRSVPGEGVTEVFSTDRRFLALVAAFSAVLAYFFFPEDALTEPTHMWLKTLSFLLCAIACGVLWFAVSRMVHPVRLEISAAGVALTRGGTEIVYAWTEIERIGVVHWVGRSDRLGLLAIRPLARAAPGPVDRTVFYLPRLAVDCLTLCTLPEVTRRPHRLYAALERFAGEGQFVPPGHDGLRPVRARGATTLAVPTEGTTFKGVRSTGVAVLIGAASFAPTFALGLWPKDQHMPVLLDMLDALVLVYLPIFALPVYYLAGRHRVTLHVGAAGVTLAVGGFRPHALRVPWGDIESIGIIAKRHPSVRHSVVLWLRPGAQPRRSMWWFYKQGYGGLRLLSLEGSRLDTTPERLDRALAHHAGRRHSRLERLPYPDLGGRG